MEETITKVVDAVRLPEIISFNEEPAVDSKLPQDEMTSQPSISASELFSMFTADIIKKDVVFTR